MRKGKSITVAIIVMALMLMVSCSQQAEAITE